MKEVLLKDLCNIRTGIPNFIDEDKNKNFKYSLIQLKDVSDDGLINSNLKQTYLKNVLSSHIVKKNEIIFKAKSVINTAAILKKEGNFVATSHYLILNVKNEKKINPDYIWWYLNQKYAQRYFKRIGAGTIQPIIKKSDLKHLKVLVPNLDKQKQIANIYNLWFKEKKLLREKIKVKEKYIKEYLIKSIEK